MSAPHLPPCRWPASPDCLCGPSDVPRVVDVVVQRAGALAEQAHLVDPLDHVFEVLPVRRPEALPEMQRMSGTPLGDTEGSAS